MPPRPQGLKLLKSGAVLLKLRRDLERSPSGLMKQIGLILLEDSERAFDEQKFGELPWAERYPAQKAPKLNIAGALADFASGRTSPKARRFQDRPAGIDTGMLRRSLAPAKAITNQGWTAFVGSNLEYAGRFHKGGVSTQPVTDAAKKNLGKFLKSKKGRPFRDKLGWLFSQTRLKTRMKARPIIGITARAEKRIVALVTSWFLGESRGNALGS